MADIPKQLMVVIAWFAAGAVIAGLIFIGIGWIRVMRFMRFDLFIISIFDGVLLMFFLLTGFSAPGIAIGLLLAGVGAGLAITDAILVSVSEEFAK